jgi:uncharacterized protein (DUF433 family)
VDETGAYTAERASALSGVPQSTIRWWARHDVLIPSVSRSKVALWSYRDLLSMRVVYWLRQRKTTTEGASIHRSSMKSVRHALAQLRNLALPLVDESGRVSVRVNGHGDIYIASADRAESLVGQLAHGDLIDLIAPFDTREGLHGPDLARPRPELRIVPGKLGGSPHVVHTRVETRALSALADDGLPVATIHRLYAYLTSTQIAEALDLEMQLQKNLRIAA